MLPPLKSSRKHPRSFVPVASAPDADMLAPRGQSACNATRALVAVLAALEKQPTDQSQKTRLWLAPPPQQEERGLVSASVQQEKSY